MLEIAGQSSGSEPPLGGDAAFRDAVRDLPCGVQLSRVLVEELNRTGASSTTENDRRRFVRFYCRVRGVLYYRQTLPAVEREERPFLVLVKNISRSGVGLLHEQQLFPHERFTLWMEGAQPREIEVARCRRLQPRCFEVGARFV